MARKKQTLSKEFICEFQELHQLAKKWQMSDEAIENCVKKAFSGDPATDCNISNIPYKIFALFFSLLFFILKSLIVLAILYIFVANHNPTQKFIMKHSQDYIYPLMRAVRLVTIPITRTFSSLSGWHEEECLFPNPLFEEPALDCWPCEGIRSLVDLTGLPNYTLAYCANEQPFLVKDVMKENVTLQLLMDLYRHHKAELDSGTLHFSSSQSGVQSILDLQPDPSSHTLWKVGRVPAARVLRQLFLRPYFVPGNTEVALQRYLMVDGPLAPKYHLPQTSFANVWIAQGQGSRSIVLKPSDPCAGVCSPVSAELHMGDVLYYNWQFWRASSLPSSTPSAQPSVSFIGSFY